MARTALQPKVKPSGAAAFVATLLLTLVQIEAAHYPAVERALTGPYGTVLTALVSAAVVAVATIVTGYVTKLVPPAVLTAVEEQFSEASAANKASGPPEGPVTGAASP